MKTIEIKEAFFDALSNILAGDNKDVGIEDIRGMHNLAETLIKKIEQEKNFEVTSYDGIPISVGDHVYAPYTFYDDSINEIQYGWDKHRVIDVTQSGCVFLSGDKYENDDPLIRIKLGNEWYCPNDEKNPVMVSQVAAMNYVNELRKQVKQRVKEDEQ